MEAKTSAKPKRKPPKRKQVEETARRYFEALQARDARAMAACWSEDGIEDIVPLRVMRGPQEVEDFFAGLFAALPDAETTIHNIVASESQAAVEWRTVGTFTGSQFEGVEATGGRLELRGLDLLEIEDDLILKNTAYYDGAAFMRQLGMLPPQDSGPEKAIKTAFNTVNKVKRTVAEKEGLAMIILVTFTVGLVIWVAGWAFGLKAFDVFMLTVLMTLIAAAAHLIRPHLDNFLGRKAESDTLGPPTAPGSQP